MGRGAGAVKKTTVSERLGAGRFEIDEEESHIHVDQELCRTTGTGRAIIAVCPAGVYSERDGEIQVEYAACLECGTCLAVAAPGALTWHYPRGGFGVSFREG
jgi:ferredoxin like protein